MVPVPAFTDGRLTDIFQKLLRRSHLPLPLDELGFGSVVSGPNLDGIYSYSDRDLDSRRAYVQLFRNGVIEGVGELRREADGQSRFVGRDFTTLVITGVLRYLEVLSSYDAGLPIYVFLSLCDAMRTVCRFGRSDTLWHDTKPVGREIVSLPEVYIDSYTVDMPTALRPAFNVLWNAVGLQQCDMYNDEGQWLGEPTT